MLISLIIDKQANRMSKKNNTYKGGAEEFIGFILLSSNENSYGPANSVISQIKKNEG